MYVAKQSFKASNGKSYRMGDILTDSEYNDLNVSDKSKVKKKAIAKAITH